MKRVSRRCELSESRQRLVEQMQRLNFGKVENLEVREGELVFNPSSRVVRQTKFGGENGPRRELEADDFVLRKEVIDFFAELDRIGDGTVERLEIKHGLPFKMSVKEEIRV